LVLVNFLPAACAAAKERTSGSNTAGSPDLENRKRYILAMVIVLAIIIYGSLYPFAFERPVDGLEPALRALWASRAAVPSRSAAIANILLYMPFGYCAMLAHRGKASGARRIALITMVGALLSIGIEIAQFFDQSRVTDAPDVYANTIGTLFGAVVARLIGGSIRWPLFSQIGAARIPTLLLAAWVGYRLFPYVPAIDLHKYWHALAPVILHPTLTGYDLFRYTAIWLAIAALIEAIVGPKRVWMFFPLFALAVLVGKVMVVDTVLSIAEIAGAVSALVWRALLGFNASARSAVVALVFCSAVMAERLEPFRFGAIAEPFGWTPFWGLMSGDLEIDTMAFLQKFFLYGSAIWLLASAGLRLAPATAVIAALLFVTSQAERFLPGRSAEVTDAVMALIIGGIFFLVGSKPDRVHREVGADQRRGWRRPGDWPH
jgi:VanZ family protein